MLSTFLSSRHAPSLKTHIQTVADCLEGPFLFINRRCEYFIEFDSETNQHCLHKDASLGTINVESLTNSCEWSMIVSKLVNLIPFPLIHRISHVLCKKVNSNSRIHSIHHPFYIAEPLCKFSFCHIHDDQSYLSATHNLTLKTIINRLKNTCFQEDL